MTEKQETNPRPLTYKLALWYSFTLAIMFLVYGGIKIVLSFLDRNFTDMSQLIIFTIYGLIIIAFAFAYRELRSWGWYGLIAINVILVVNAIIKMFGLEFSLAIFNIILAAISIGIIYCLIAPPTKNYLLNRQ